MEEFYARYAEKRPVVILNQNQNLNPSILSLFSKDSLLKNYGESHIYLSTANTHSYKKVQVPLRDYVTDMMHAQNTSVSGEDTLYHFGMHKDEFGALFAHYQRPIYARSYQHSYSWGLSGDGTGVPFHFHNHVFAEVLVGRKWWFLYPYEKKPEFDPNDTTLNWVRERLPLLGDGEQPLQCILLPGQVLYLPSLWYHATLNLGQTVFMSTFV